MEAAHVQLVKHRLDEYSCYKALAEEYERKADALQSHIDTVGGYHSPILDSPAPGGTGTGSAWSSKLTALVADQQDLMTEAARWHDRMADIEQYIGQTFEGVTKDIAIMRYVKGMTYDDVADSADINASTARMRVTRALSCAEYADAVDILRL